MQVSKLLIIGEYKMEQGNKKKGSFLSGILIGLAVAFLLSGATYFAMWTIEEKRAEENAVDKELYEKLQLLEQTVKYYYYKDDVTNEEFEDGIYKGLVSSLNDPYSEYYSPEELNDLMEQTEGVYYGIGAYVSVDTATSLTKISGVIEGAPAQEADLRANDLIYEVDGTSTYGMSLDEVVALIKGEEGTQVMLTIVREGETDYLEIPVERRKVESPTVSYEMLDDVTGYIQITEFDDVTVDQFADALATVKGSGMQKLILDLRANPGGSLTAVVDIARMLLPEGMIVYTEDKYGHRNEYTCDGTRELGMPMVVLVDMNSASASEILAGAIKDHGAGTLVGTTTFGKGIVQQVIPLSDGSAIKVTISSYYTPSGQNIHDVGIEPDVECAFDGELYYNSDNPVDTQLEKAKEIIAGM